jgi:hypothetical protein
VVVADKGQTITVTVTREGYAGSVSSSPTITVTDPTDPPLTGTVSISGTAEVGQTLTAVTTSLGGSGTISYQWKRNSTTVVGTNSSTYVVQAADAGSTITVTVTRIDYSGSVTSVPTAEVPGGGPLRGKTYFEWNRRIVFSTTTGGATSGTYTIGEIAYDGEYHDPILVDGKFTYADSETGTYTWNEGTITVTMQPQRVAYESNGPMLDINAYRAALQNMVNEYIAEVGQAAVNEMLSEAGFASVAAFINYMANDAFAVKVNGYSFSADRTALFLEEQLPANVGVNELSGQTYYGIDWDASKDLDQVYVFTASTYTYTDSRWGGEPQTATGSYAYDSIENRVWLRPSLINGKDRAAYYAEQTVEVSHNFINDNAFRAAQTNDHFVFWEQMYNTTTKTIGWE